MGRLTMKLKQINDLLQYFAYNQRMEVSEKLASITKPNRAAISVYNK